MTRAVFGWPRAVFAQVPVVLALTSAVTVSAQAPAAATPPAPAAPVTAPAPVTTPPATAVSTSAAVSGSATAAPSPAVDATVPEDRTALDWDRAHRRYSTWYGPTGGLFLFDGRASVAGAIRVQLGLDGFTGSDFLRTEDNIELSNQTLALNVSATKWLEVYATLSNRSAHQTKPAPVRSLDTLGDVSLGGRAGMPLGGLFDLGADLRVTLTNQTGGGGFEWGATSVALRTALSMDLERLANPIPLLFRLNLGYVFDNSAVVVEPTENARYDRLSSPADKADETEHLVSRFERYAMNVNRLDRLVGGVGVELPLKVAEKFYLHPIVEWQMGLPINRQSYDCAYVVDTPDIGTNKSDVDSCYERDMASLPMNLGFGVRVVPPVRGLSAVLGVDIGLLGTTTFVRDLAPNTPWRVLVGFSYDYDARPQAAGPQYIPVEVDDDDKPVVAAAITGRVQGSVATADNRAVANARVRYIGLPITLTDMITGADGHFVTEPLPPGAATLEVSHPEYETSRCSATIAAKGGDVPLLCTLKASPVVGTVNGQIAEGAGLPVSGARVILSGPTSSLLLTDAQGAFTLPDLPAGSYQLRVEAGGYFIQLSSFTIDKRGNLPLTVTLRRKPIAPTISYVGDTVEAPTIQYATDTATVPLASSQAAIAEIADLLLSRPDLYLQVLGFGPTNEVGLARAQVIKQKLIEAGIQANHVDAAGGGITKLRFVLHR
jgi:OmpA-OmpF porin, OOP family